MKHHPLTFTKKIVATTGLLALLLGAHAHTRTMKNHGVRRSVAVSQSNAFRITLASNYLPEGASIPAEVELAQPAPAGGYDVEFYTYSYKIDAPTHIAVPEGETTAEFKLVAEPTDSNSPFRLLGVSEHHMAYVDGTVRSLTLQKLRLANYTPKAGQSTVGSFSLEAPALRWGKHAYFATNNPAVTVDQDVWLAPGQQNGSFRVNVGKVPSGTKVMISCRIGDRIGQTTVLTVK